MAEIIKIKIKQKEKARIKDLSMTKEQLEECKGILKYLNDKDLDILYLIFVSGKKQSEVQFLLNRTQPSLSYDIRRIKSRLEYICYMNEKKDEFIDFIRTSKDTYSSEEKDILTSMFFTTSLTHSAEILNCRQSKVRYLFERLIKKMKKNKDWEMYELFFYIKNNLNIIKRNY